MRGEQLAFMDSVQPYAVEDAHSSSQASLLTLLYFEPTETDSEADKAERYHDAIAKLEADKRTILAEGPPAPKGTWIEQYTARRRRKSGRVVDYLYYRLVDPHGKPRHRNLGRQDSAKYRAAIAAQDRRRRLAKVERQLKKLQELISEE